MHRQKLLKLLEEYKEQKTLNEEVYRVYKKSCRLF